MATFALLIWPLVSMGLFSTLGRARGLVWSAVAGYLLLPEAWSFDFPVLPPFGKREAIALGMLLGVLVTRQGAEPLPTADSRVKGILTVLVALLFLTPFVTMLTNRDGYMIGPLWFPPIGLSEVQGALFGSLVTLTPFFLARRYLHSPEVHRELLKAMVIMGLFYSLLALYELRMSPQLNNMVYGYFPHSWMQHIRGGGWRPLVFLSHGLELGFFLLTAVLAGIGLLRTASRERRTAFLVATILLLIMLAISRNLGAFAICLLLAPLALLTAPKTQVRIALIAALLFTTYPMVRSVYIEPLLSIAESISEDRHGSLRFRFINEDLLLERAFERPVAGWGPWARSRVHGENGEDLAVSDGLWVIQLGVWGWMGFIGFFGLLMAPIFLMKRAVRYRPHSPLTSVLALMIAANLIYIIPNSTLSPVGWLVAGALAGYVQFAPGRARTEEDDGADAPGDAPGRDRRRSRYTRFGPGHSRADPVRRSRFTSGA